MLRVLGVCTGVGGGGVWWGGGVYASHGGEVEAHLTEAATRKLEPQWISPLHVEGEFSDFAARYRLEWESLERQRAPVYPAKRFLIGAYVAWLSQSGLKPGDYVLQVTEPGGYFSATRRVYVLMSDLEMTREFQKSWFNLLSRQ